MTNSLAHMRKELLKYKSVWLMVNRRT